MNMDAAARMALLKFVCSFVWTDLKVQQQERDLVMWAAGRLGIGGKDLDQIKRWLAVPPKAEDVDPSSIPRAHRQLFLDAAEAAIKADGRVVPAERDALAMFRELLADEAS